MRSVGILTLGCKVNTYESEYIMNVLKENNYEIKSFDDICDVYIINTCTVTNTSDIKSRKMIRNAIKKNKDACIVAMGCFIEANKDYNIEGLDIVIGNKDKSKIVELLDEYFTKKETIIKLYNDPKSQFEDMYITNFPGRTRAFVKIQDGCENFCSYCIIPYVRGKCRSKDEDKVISEIKSLVNNGYQEVVLTGIHTGNYGVDLDTNFAHLLKELIKIKGLKRLRISSIEATELTDEVLKVIKESNVIVDHLHIPLQAGSDEILKAIKEGTLKVDHIDDFVKDFKRLFEVTDKASDMTRFGAVAARLTGGTLTDDLIMAFKGVAKSNIASLIIDLVIEVTVMVMVNNAKEMFTRFLKSIQAVDVYPLKR